MAWKRYGNEQMWGKLTQKYYSKNFVQWLLQESEDLVSKKVKG